MRVLSFRFALARPIGNSCDASTRWEGPVAVLKCGECDGKVSDQAGACPHCGAPVRAQPAGAASPKKKGRIRRFAELVVAGVLAFPVVLFVGAKLASVKGEARVDGPYVMVLDGKTPVAWAKSETNCEYEREVEFPSPKIECVPEAKAPKMPAGGWEIAQASAREGSTAWVASKYVRYAPGVYSPARCKARAAILSSSGLQGSFGVVSRYACQAAPR
jgi:hypothetical protein